MKVNLQQSKNPKQQKKEVILLFSKRNYILMIIGLLFLAVGFILLSGGGSDNPSVFNEAIYNTRRLVIAPILLFIGYALQFFAILWVKDKTKKENKEHSSKT